MPGVFAHIDTIFALSTGRLPSGVAIIRLSGPHARTAISDMAGVVPRPRQLAYAVLRDAHEQVLDRGMVAYFPAPASFTGEDCAELHLHGGRAVVAAVLRELARMKGLRQADAGEFTRRAHLNGKMDLTSAEALADLIDAETEAQRRLAIENASGVHARLYTDWRARMTNVRALLESELDFADEGDVPDSLADEMERDIAELVQQIRTHLSGYRRAEIIRDGFRVAIVGPPNVGKSSLLNALARRDVAIVADEPGTTRDLIEVVLDLNGWKVIVTDTAGIRETQDKIELLGIARSRRAASEAHLLIILEDLNAADENGFELGRAEVLKVGTKSDLCRSEARANYDVVVSALTGEGIQNLLDHILAEAARYEGQSADPGPFRERQVQELNAALAALESVSTINRNNPELRAEQLRVAATAMGRLIGDIDVEDILDVVFSRFCIGK